MESVDYKKLFNKVYLNKKVLVTGHTGFKGSWLCKWLELMGAEVLGYSLKPNTNPNHFELLKLNCSSIYNDIRNISKLEETIENFKPDIIFHLAAQPLVRESYKNPYETIQTNIIGTSNIFEVARKQKNIKAIVNITTDKCYRNIELENKSYKEDDCLGGYDIYSASKACSELITSSYRDSFFNPKEFRNTHNTLIATCRAGNVIGGGDWSEDRLIPDIIKAIEKDTQVLIRNPASIRPWQYVLEPLSGYLQLGQYLLEGKSSFVGAWNFGPENSSEINVENIVKNIKKYWDKLEYKIEKNKDCFHEANFLKLDSSKVKEKLKWEPVLDIEECIEQTITWYKSYYEDNKIDTKKSLDLFISKAKNKNLKWCND